MLALSHSTGYAVLALACVASAKGARVLARDIATCTEVPRAYLSKILRSLVDAGILDAKRGTNGGFSLSRPADRIAVSEVATAIEGEGWDRQCLLGYHSCDPEQDCPTYAFWTDIRQQVRRELDRLTLEEVAAFEHRSGRACACVPNTPCTVSAPAAEADATLTPSTPLRTESEPCAHASC